MALGTIGTTALPTATPRPRSASQRMTPSAAERPKAEPPERQMPSTRSTRQAGSSRSVSRVPGAPPRISTEAMAGVSHSTTLTPERRRVSWALPTRMPSTSVMRLRGPGRSDIDTGSVEMERHGLEIGGLGQARMHGMIERRAGAAQDAALALGVSQAATDLLGEQRHVDQVRAGGHEQEAARRHQGRREPHPFAVAL